MAARSKTEADSITQADRTGAVSTGFKASQVARSFKLDVLRLSATGRVSLWVMLLVPLVFCTLISLVNGDVVAAGTAGGAIGMCAVFGVLGGMMIFGNEESTGNIAMNGVIPVSRFNQVAARYALTLVIAVVMAVEALLCLLIASRGGRILDISVLRMVEVSVGILLISIFLEGISLPLSYRFPSTKAMGFAFVFLFGLFAVILLIIKFVPQQRLDVFLHWVAAAKVGFVSSVFLIGAVIAIAVYVVSFLVSQRIYARKEL